MYQVVDCRHCVCYLAIVYRDIDNRFPYLPVSSTDVLSSYTVKWDLSRYCDAFGAFFRQEIGNLMRRRLALTAAKDYDTRHLFLKKKCVFLCIYKMKTKM